MLKTLLGKLLDLMTEHTYPLFMYQPSYYQIRSNVTVCQNDSIMTLYCVKVGSQSYLADCQEFLSFAHM